MFVFGLFIKILILVLIKEICKTQNKIFKTK